MIAMTEDGSTDWYRVIDADYSYLWLENDFGGGYIKVEKYLNGQAFPLREAATNIPYMYNKAGNYELKESSPGDLIRVTLVNSTSPDLYVKFAGCVKVQ